MTVTSIISKIFNKNKSQEVFLNNYHRIYGKGNLRELKIWQKKVIFVVHFFGINHFSACVTHLVRVVVNVCGLSVKTLSSLIVIQTLLKQFELETV